VRNSYKQLLGLLVKSSAKDLISEAKIKKMLKEGTGLVIFFDRKGFQGEALLRWSHAQEDRLESGETMPDGWKSKTESFLFFVPEQTIQIFTVYEHEYFSGAFIRFCGPAFVSDMNILRKAPYELGVGGNSLDAFMFEER